MSLVRFKPTSWIVAALLAAAPWTHAHAAPLKILAFGTSLTQGYGLPPGTEYPAVLEDKLSFCANIEAKIINAGVSWVTPVRAVRRGSTGHLPTIPTRPSSNWVPPMHYAACRPRKPKRTCPRFWPS